MADQPETRHVNDAAMWFGCLGGAVAWTLHLLGAWGISEFGCLAGLHRWQWLGLTLVAWLVIGLSIAMLLLAAGATWVAYRLQVRLNVGESPAVDAFGTATFLARAGLITSGLFLFIILAQCVPILYFLTGC